MTFQASYYGAISHLHTHHSPVLRNRQNKFGGHNFCGWPISRSLPPVASVECTVACPRDIPDYLEDSYWLMQLNRCFGALGRI